jgi:hypothetical protein
VFFPSELNDGHSPVHDVTIRINGTSLPFQSSHRDSLMFLYYLLLSTDECSILKNVRIVKMRWRRQRNSTSNVHIPSHMHTVSLLGLNYTKVDVLQRDELVRIHPYIQIVSQFVRQIGLQLILKLPLCIHVNWKLKALQILLPCTCITLTQRTYWEISTRNVKHTLIIIL